MYKNEESKGFKALDPFFNFSKFAASVFSGKMTDTKVSDLINLSNYISRDLSWLRFNTRVLDQAVDPNESIFERLKFLAITGSNFDEFCMIRLGSLYNYIDYGKERIDYSGLREKPFRALLLEEAQRFFAEQNDCYANLLKPEFTKNGFDIIGINDLTNQERDKASLYFKKTIYPMLTPMVFDGYHTFPVLMNKILIFGVVTSSPDDIKNQKKLSFVQIPQNLPRFYELEREGLLLFLPIEEVIRWQIDKLYRNIEILSVNLFRITRNGDFTLEESDDIEADFIDEVKRKLKTRRTGRVVRIEVEDNHSSYMMKVLKQRWELDFDDVFITRNLIDYTGLWQIIGHQDFRNRRTAPPAPVSPVSCKTVVREGELFEYLKHKDILLHHPYNSIEPVLQLLEQAAEDPYVLAIKLTIYRLAKDSRVTNALLKAAENGKHVSVLFEVKARFDEENNIREAQRLQRAGCFVIYGISSYKTHTKLLLIVRKEEEKVTRYVHLSSGNYNEQTARLYTDVGLLTTNEIYAHDVSEFFNVITGHSQPGEYQSLLTAPRDLRNQLINLIRNEAQNAAAGLPSGIVIKVNSLEDSYSIDELYQASQAGVPIKLIIRGICCLRPGREGVSENITVRSIVGEYLEHTRIYYFHNNGDPKVYCGSADMMNRSFDRRLESLFQLENRKIKQEAINILDYNLKDNVNTYLMQEDGTYIRLEPGEGEEPFNSHKEFYNVTEEIIMQAKLFD
jgi:polyphosphate kinase